MKKFFCFAIFFAVLLLTSSMSFAASHKQNFITFLNSVTEAANKITWSGQHNFQDVEFVRNEMDGDETVYARAWYSDYYILIRKYTDKTWAKSEVSDFWTSSEELTFANGIKVGSSVDDVKAFFGKEHVWQQSPSKLIVEWEEESDAGIYLVFSVENNRITSIAYRDWYNRTSKMVFLFSLYADSEFAEVTGEKVNVRRYTGYGFGKDKVLFQVSKSKGDCLLVDLDSPEKDWCFVDGRVINNSFKYEPRKCYISKKFLNIRKLSISERKSYISQYLKNKK